MNEPVKISEVFSTLLPAKPEEEYKKLEKHCCKHGIEDPIRIWHEFIIDGHNRYKIAEDNDLNYEVKDMTDELDTEADVIRWMLDREDVHRKLTKSQLVEAWAKYEAERAKEAEAKLHLAKGKGVKGSSNLNEVKNGIRTAAEVAKKIGVSENTYRNMKIVTNEGTAEQISRMDNKEKVMDSDGNVKPVSASGIKYEIEIDKKIVKQLGTDEQKKRMEEGGEGNKPTEIADEIRKEKDVDAEMKKKCIKCGKELPLSYFEKGRRQCKDCRKPVKNPNSEERNMRNIDAHLNGNSKVEITIDDVINEFCVNFNGAIESAKYMFTKTYRNIAAENQEKVINAMKAEEDLFQNMKGEVIDELRCQV